MNRDNEIGTLVSLEIHAMRRDTLKGQKNGKLYYNNTKITKN